MIIKNVIPSNDASVDSSTTNISIHFNSNVDLSIGNITIFKASDNSIRQIVSATSEFCKLTADETIINISVISSTFNEYGEKYYVKMDNHFAKTKLYNEPLRGIENGDSRVKHSDEDVTGLIQLTQSATKKFSNFSEPERLNYFDALKQELINKVPVKKSNLILGPKFELANERIIIQLRIGRNTKSDLDTMIKYKSITTFSSGVSNDLDQDFGIKDLPGGPWDNYRTK
ncbi:hypothetical protein C2G38_1227029 [Gigaspora rosea]|uniref:SbsA Ig-like domain-containing protein n=1 Tax=Gigaspora rosea TaxID=44941 RepID=A0A397VDV8_9GLOM|nr:hypothetical protein C2G38_1227029 [Gigaspora rosea]